MINTLVLFMAVCLVLVLFMYLMTKEDRTRIEQELLEYKRSVQTKEQRAVTDKEKQIAEREREIYESLKAKYYAKYGRFPDADSGGE